MVAASSPLHPPTLIVTLGIEMRWLLKTLVDCRELKYLWYPDRSLQLCKFCPLLQYRARRRLVRQHLGAVAGAGPVLQEHHGDVPLKNEGWIQKISELKVSESGSIN